MVLLWRGEVAMKCGNCLLSPTKMYSGLHTSAALERKIFKEGGDPPPPFTGLKLNLMGWDTCVGTVKLAEGGRRPQKWFFCLARRRRDPPPSPSLTTPTF